MVEPTERLELKITHPHENREIPVGSDFQVHGTAAPSTRGAGPAFIASVTVHVGSGPPVNAGLSAHVGHRPFMLAFSAMMRLTTPGAQQVTVKATDDSGRSITEIVTILTPGDPHCQARIPWINYPKTEDFSNGGLPPYSTCTPGSLAGLVAIVREAEAAHKHVHAFGSRWSFSDCAYTSDYVINTRYLNRALQTVQRALRPGQSPLLYHVEAGIRIQTLYHNLHDLGLALETMGGASGQTLAGAMSKGTHGGDKFMAPLADSVLAIHLVGAGGAQFWIEPSSGITDPALVKAHVVPDIDPQNIIYDDATFDACLVSLGCMGVIYAVVLRVRAPYDLVETTYETTWQAFQAGASTFLNTPNSRFLQVLVNPYADSTNANFCLVTRRSEAAVTGPVHRPRGDEAGAVENMVRSLNHSALLTLQKNGVFDDTVPPMPPEQRLAKIVQGILTYTPDQRPVMVAHYENILRAPWPSGTFQGSSYSVMDIGYSQADRWSQPGYSIELHFSSMDAQGRLGFAEFIDAVIAAVNAATATFFAGYISLRFTGATRACLGMQQWKQTCAVEISTVQGVQGLLALLTELFKMGFERGGLPHWGQLLDLSVQGHGSVYPRYAQWRQIYSKMSNNFTARTFANALSERWHLTTPPTPPLPGLEATSEPNPIPTGRRVRVIIHALDQQTRIQVAGTVHIVNPGEQDHTENTNSWFEFTFKKKRASSTDPWEYPAAWVEASGYPITEVNIVYR